MCEKRLGSGPKLGQKQCIWISVAEPELEPEPPFLGRFRSRSRLFGRSEPRTIADFLRRLRLHLLGKQK